MAVENESIDGVLNLTAPSPVRNIDLCRGIGRVLRRPCWLPAPRWALRVVLGRVVQVICEGQRVLPVEAKAAGYQFEFPELDAALRDTLGK